MSSNSIASSSHPFLVFFICFLCFHFLKRKRKRKSPIKKLYLWKLAEEKWRLKSSERLALVYLKVARGRQLRCAYVLELTCFPSALQSFLSRLVEFKTSAVLLCRGRISNCNSLYYLKNRYFSSSFFIKKNLC